MLGRFFEFIKIKMKRNNERKMDQQHRISALEDFVCVCFFSVLLLYSARPI